MLRARRSNAAMNSIEWSTHQAATSGKNANENHWQWPVTDHQWPHGLENAVSLGDHHWPLTRHCLATGSETKLADYDRAVVAWQHAEFQMGTQFSSGSTSNASKAAEQKNENVSSNQKSSLINSPWQDEIRQEIFTESVERLGRRLLWKFYEILEAIL